jgi:hypothetical protein
MLECSPLILLGGPDCQSFGDCPRDPAIFGSWGGNPTSNPPIGELLYVRFYDAVNGGWAHGYSKGNAPGYLRKIENGTFTVEMVPLWKFDETTIPRQDGSSAPTGGYSYSYSYDGAYNLINNSRHPSVQYKRCCMAPRNNGRMFYPAECIFDSSLVGMEPEVLQVKREQLSPRTDYLAWAAVNENYIPGSDLPLTRYGAFGSWYSSRLKQDDLYLTSSPPYSEFIQATVKIPVYIVGVEVGFSNGGGTNPPHHPPVAWLACLMRPTPSMPHLTLPHFLRPLSELHSYYDKCHRMRCRRAGQDALRHMAAALHGQAFTRRGTRAEEVQDVLEVVSQNLPPQL